MHRSYYITPSGGVGNRDGSMYRNYADGKGRNIFCLTKPLIVGDIVKIGMNSSQGFNAGDKNLELVHEIFRRQLACKLFEPGKFDYGNPEKLMDSWLYAMFVVFNFGFMQGGHAVREKRRRGGKAARP